MTTPSAQSLLEQAHAYRGRNQFAEALASLKQAIALYPGQPEGWEQAAYILLNRKKWVEARQLLTLALNAFPQHAVMRAYYALALAKTGETANAYTHITQALGQNPAMVEGMLTRIEILCDAGYYDLALQESLRLPRDVIPETATFNEGALSFLTGDMTHGMKSLASVLKSGWRGKELPEWNGEASPHQHVLLYNSQAFGDLIQFARYIPRIREKVGKVTLQVPKAMLRLMRDSFPTLNIIADDEEIPVGVTSRYALLALADEAVFNARADNVPYIRTTSAVIAEWRQRLAYIPHPRIGVVWASPWQMNNPFRVADFKTLQPLAEIASKHFVSLQLGPEAKQIAGTEIFDASPFIKDFADSAALMSELDLIISLDSAPAHLAGALGKPVWVFLPFNAEWRWLAGREDCIWYPTMRLFRQSKTQDWCDVFATMRAELEKFLTGDKSVLKVKPWDGVTHKRHPHTLPLQGV